MQLSFRSTSDSGVILEKLLKLDFHQLLKLDYETWYPIAGIKSASIAETGIV